MMGTCMRERTQKCKIMLNSLNVCSRLAPQESSRSKLKQAHCFMSFSIQYDLLQ